MFYWFRDELCTSLDHCEVRDIKGHYYIYAVTLKWDPEKNAPKRSPVPAGAQSKKCTYRRNRLCSSVRSMRIKPKLDMEDEKIIKMYRRL